MSTHGNYFFGSARLTHHEKLPTTKQRRLQGYHLFSLCFVHLVLLLILDWYKQSECIVYQIYVVICHMQLPPPPMSLIVRFCLTPFPFLSVIVGIWLTTLPHFSAVVSIFQTPPPTLAADIILLWSHIDYLFNLVNFIKIFTISIWRPHFYLKLMYN